MVPVRTRRVNRRVKRPQKRRVLRVGVPRNPPPARRFQADPLVGGHKVSVVAVFALGLVARAGPKR